MKELNNKAKLYILATVVAGLGLIIWHLASLSWSNIVLLLVMIVLGSVTHVLKIEGPTARSNYQISFVVYGFTLILRASGLSSSNMSPSYPLSLA